MLWHWLKRSGKLPLSHPHMMLLALSVGPILRLNGASRSKSQLHNHTVAYWAASRVLWDSECRSLHWLPGWTPVLERISCRSCCFFLQKDQWRLTVSQEETLLRLFWFGQEGRWVQETQRERETEQDKSREIKLCYWPVSCYVTLVATETSEWKRKHEWERKTQAAQSRTSHTSMKPAVSHCRGFAVASQIS